MHGLRIFDGGSSPAPPNSPDQSPTVAEVIDWFLSRYTSTNRDALKEVRRVLRLFTGRFGPVPVCKLIGDDLVSFVESECRGLRGQAPAANTIGRWYRTIKMPFNQAEQLGRIHHSPLKHVRIPRGERGRDLTPVEFRALLRSANPFYRRVLLFLRFSGARPGELRELTWPMIHWHTTGALIVKKRHKTSRTQAVPKPRKIYLPIPLVKLLLWLKRRSTSDFVFVNSHGGPWRTGSLCKYLRGLRTKARLSEEVKLYGCRHAFATNAVMNGCNVADLAELMGHASTVTTQIYLHLAGKDDHLSAALERATGMTSRKMGGGVEPQEVKTLRPGSGPHAAAPPGEEVT